MISLRLLAPLLSLVALAAGTALLVRRDGRIRPATVAWLAVPVLALVWLTVWLALDLYHEGRKEIVLVCAAALVAGACALGRDRVRGALASRGPLVHAIVTLVGFLACTVLTFLALELPSLNVAELILPQFALLECALILGTALALYYLLQRRGAGVAVLSTVLLLVGVAQFFVRSFKGAAILPTDLLVLGTAAAVSGGYVYAVKAHVLLAISCWLLCVAVSSLMVAFPAVRADARRRSVLGNLGAGLACALAVALGVVLPSYEGLGVEISYWDTAWTYRIHGFLPSFIAITQDLAIEVPEGYSDESAAELEASYVATYDETRGASESRVAAEEQFSELQPSVVYVVNETFADLNSLGDEPWGYAGPERYNSREDTLLRGALSVSITGGGTANSEFEVLTGVSLAYVGEGKYPFSLYDLSLGPSVIRQFKDLGYETTAMHPNIPNNYNRLTAYEGLGFDTYLSIEDFEGAEWFHSGVSDAATYEKVLEVLESSDQPQFIFDLTMQNHSSYDQNNLGDVPQYSIDGLDEDENAQLSEYIACIEESDRALEEFLGELEELDRPVVVVFLGDHESRVAPFVNDALHPGETGYAHETRLYETIYTVWANYDVAGAEQNSPVRDTGISYVTALALDVIGAPLTDLQKAQVVASEELPAVTAMGVRDLEGTWVPLDEASTVSSVYDDLQTITYLEFGRHVS